MRLGRRLPSFTSLLPVGFLLGLLAVSPPARAAATPGDQRPRTVWALAGSTIDLDRADLPAPGVSVPLRSRRSGLEVAAEATSREGHPALSLPASLPPDWYDLPAGDGGRSPLRLKVLRDARLLRVVHLTDIHWDEDPRQRALLDDALEAIRLLDPDVVLCGGDLMTDPTEEGMAELARSFDTLPVPVLFAPGNHDHRHLDLFRRHVSARTWYSVDAGPFHLVVLDTGKADFIGSHRGEGIEEDQLRWLEEDLRLAEGKSVYVLTHHSAAPGSDSFDEGSGELRRLAAKHAVKAVFSGHGHYDKVVDLAVGKELRAFGPGVPVVHTTTLGSSRLRGKGRGFRLVLLTPAGIAPETPWESVPAGTLSLRVASAGEGCRASNGGDVALPGVRLDLLPGNGGPGGRLLWKGSLRSLAVESMAVDLPPGDLAVPGCIEAFGGLAAPLQP